jgi:hypothetical protein
MSDPNKPITKKKLKELRERALKSEFNGIAIAEADRDHHLAAIGSLLELLQLQQQRKDVITALLPVSMFGPLLNPGKKKK